MVKVFMHWVGGSWRGANGAGDCGGLRMSIVQSCFWSATLFTAIILRIPFACLFLAVAGWGTTPAERIEEHRTLCTWPSGVQAGVRAG